MWSCTYKKCLQNLTFQEKFLTTCSEALKFPWRTFQPVGYVLSGKLTFFLLTKDKYILVNKTLSITRWVVGGTWRSQRRRSRRREEKSISLWPSGFELFFFTIFEQSIKFRQRNLLGHDPLVQFFHAGITSPFGCVGCTILMCIGCTILMRNRNSQTENNLSDSPAPRRTNNSPVKNTGWSDKQWFQL